MGGAEGDVAGDGTRVDQESQLGGQIHESKWLVRRFLWGGHFSLTCSSVGWLFQRSKLVEWELF